MHDVFFSPQPESYFERFGRHLRRLWNILLSRLYVASRSLEASRQAWWFFFKSFLCLNNVASTFQNISPLILNHLGRVFENRTLCLHVYYCGIMLNRRRVVFICCSISLLFVRANWTNLQIFLSLFQQNIKWLIQWGYSLGWRWQQSRIPKCICLWQLNYISVFKIEVLTDAIARNKSLFRFTAKPTNIKLSANTIWSLWTSDSLHPSLSAPPTSVNRGGGETHLLWTWYLTKEIGSLYIVLQTFSNHNVRQHSSPALN